MASACFAVAAFSSRGARARRWCSLCWRKSLRRLGGFGVLCRRRLQLARCALLDAGALCAGVSRFGGSVASACFAVAALSSRGARARRWCSLCWRRKSPQAFCAGGVSRFGGSVASTCFAVATFSSRGARARRWRPLCWHKLPRAHGVRPQHAPHGVCTLSTCPMASALEHAPHGVCPQQVGLDQPENGKPEMATPPENGESLPCYLERRPRTRARTRAA